MLGFGACDSTRSMENKVNSLDKQIRELQEMKESLGRMECVYGGPNLNDDSWKVVRSETPEQRKIQSDIDKLVKEKNELKRKIEEAKK